MRPLYGACGKECANICHIDSGAHRAIALMKFEMFRGNSLGVNSVDFFNSGISVQFWPEVLNSTEMNLVEHNPSTNQGCVAL
jgi:hypothetical protein